MAEKFCLKWNDFERSISSAFKDIREENEFFDITLACDGTDTDQLQAHKVILSACSPFFRRVLKRNPHQHPLLYLKGVTFKDLQAVLNFMYHGEVNVAQDDLNSFLAVAEELQVKGLTQNNSSSDASNSKPKTSSTSSSLSSGEHRNIIPTPRVRPSDSSENVPAPKRFRSSEPIPSLPLVKQPQHIQEDDDIQEVVPVKAEPPGALAPPPTDPGTMAMYEEEGLDESAYDENYQEYDEQGEYTEQNYLVQGQDGATGHLYREACPFCSQIFHKAGIKRHIDRKHTAENEVTCHVCQRVVKGKYNLRIHLRSVHQIYATKTNDF